jgi:hypothetical protein
MFLKIIGFFISIFFYSNALAIACTQEDWILGFCDLPVASEPRCAIGANNWVARGACVAATSGCAEIGGCFGSTPVGHWWPVNENGADKRCQCGCFAEETEFESDTGLITGTEMIELNSNTPLFVKSLDSIYSGTITNRAINGIVYGTESDKVFKIKTENNFEIILSSEHPVPIVNAEGNLQLVKTAKHVSLEDYLITLNGTSKVSEITKLNYTKRMVNFNVMSANPEHHFLPASGIILGDNAWQQRLASVDSRILLRSDLVREIENKSEQKTNTNVTNKTGVKK